MLTAFYTILCVLVLIATLTMEFRLKRERRAAILAASLLAFASVVTQVIRPTPSVDDISLYVVMDFTVAVMALMLFLRNPRTWSLTLTGLSLSMMFLDMFWEQYVNGDFHTKNIWAWVNNGIYLGQLGCILYAAMEFTIRRRWIIYKRSKDPHYGTVWRNKGERLRADEDKI